MYLSSIFLVGVLGYTQVGHTAFNLSGSLRIASGVSASINFGSTGSFSSVGIPTGSHVVTSADVNRILVLKSSLFPRHNSGLFRVSSVNTGSNHLNVEYRSSEDPPAETNTLVWSLWPAENTIQGPTPYVANGGTPTAATGYKSRFPYTDKKIILQSPHSSSWQVRYCNESSSDRQPGLSSFATQLTVAPGFGGDVNGDFSSGSYDSSNIVEHLHGYSWFDVNSANYRGSTVGIDMTNSSPFNDVSNAIIRFYVWGDDETGSACFCYRNVSSYVDGWYSFGMAETDAPLPTRTSQRLFVFGRSHALTTFSIKWNNGGSIASQGDYIGVAFGESLLRPVSCVWSAYDYVGSAGGDGIKGESLAGDNAMLGSTEVQKVDLWAGTLESGNQLSEQMAVYHYDPRRMGSMPLARIGRSNFGTWSTSSDASLSWLHTTNGVYFPWTGPTVLA
jgi:hypothetical protein